jgi:hypothetical protein
MRKITTKNITERQIQTLCAEASAAGDMSQVAMCEAALGCLHYDRDDFTVRACADAINDAAAQEEADERAQYEADAHWASATLDAQHAR